MPPPIVGLTGGIASGKSTVARAFAARGVPIVDADQIARDVVAVGSDGLAAVIAAFGDGLLLSDGSLDRKSLGTLVFQDSTARAKLNAILHPRIAMESAARFAALDEHVVPYAMYEAALLVENGLHKALAALVLVAVPEDVQLTRLMTRDGMDVHEARARVDAQMPLTKKLPVADYVIWNDGRLEDLDAKVDEVHGALLDRLGRRNIGRSERGS